MKALFFQIKSEIKKFNTTLKSIESIFIGGGTPSTINPTLYIKIFDYLKPYMIDNCEVTTEANPNSATKNWLEGMKNLGVNRISFGVQSFNNQKLKSLNRNHSKDDAINAITTAKKIGFENISLDLIYNFKNDTKELILNDINQAFKLDINHISAYELTIEDGTKFSSTPEVRKDDFEIAQFVSNEIQKRGFTQYEISNYGLYQSVHNKGYWLLKDYIGAGAGAVGFQKNKRFYPHIDIDLYIKEPLFQRIEDITQDDILFEKLFLGFRSKIGVDRDILNLNMQKQADFLCLNNKIFLKKNRYYNSNYFLSDEVVLYITQK